MHKELKLKLKLKLKKGLKKPKKKKITEWKKADNDGMKLSDKSSD